MKKDLLKEAIADAKRVKQTAIANAKIALEEAFAPRIQAMLSAKLREEDDEFADDEPVTEEDEEFDDVDAVEEGEEFTDDDAVEEGEEFTDDDAVEEGEEFEDEPVEEGEEDVDGEIDQELEEIIRTLESEIRENAASSEIGKGDNKQPSKNSSTSTTDDPGKGKLKTKESAEYRKHKAILEAYLKHLTEGEDVDVEEEDITEILKSLREDDGETDSDDAYGDVSEGEDEDVPVDAETVSELANGLKEAYAVIEYLRKSLKETNLLNSKLLYTNRLFKAYSLNENQKMKIIDTFDTATSVREAKLVYITLRESFRSTQVRRNAQKNSIKESVIKQPSKLQRLSNSNNGKILNEDKSGNRLQVLANITRNDLY